MQLLTDEIRSQLPSSIEELEDDKNTMVYAKFFTPDTTLTWYVMAGEPFPDSVYQDDFLFFGWVVGHEKEYRYFSLHNLEELRGVLGLPVERDIAFEPTTIAEVHKLYPDYHPVYEVDERRKLLN